MEKQVCGPHGSRYYNVGPLNQRAPNCADPSFLELDSPTLR